MTASHVVGERGATYQPREILVSLAHVDQVVTVLRECGASVEIPDERNRSRLLDLALVCLGTDVRLPAVKDALLADVPCQYQRNVPKEFAGDDDLDPVLAALRAHFASNHGGWSPTVGKNRLVGWVGGVDGIVQHNAEEDLRAAGQADQFAPRGVGPGQGVTIGVLDTGIAGHPWLEGGWIARSTDVLTCQTYQSQERPPYLRQQGHATFIAGLILREAPGATVRVRSVLDEQGKADVWTVANAIVEFGRTGLDILNLSFACYTEDGQPPLALSTAIARLDPNIVVVAAAGNHGKREDGRGASPNDSPASPNGAPASPNGAPASANGGAGSANGAPMSPNGAAGGPDGAAKAPDPRQPAWPAALDGVIAVGALNGDKIACFTPEADWIDAYEQGVDLLSTYLSGPVQGMTGPFDGWAWWSGTSFSAAVYSGKVAAAMEGSRSGTLREALNRIR